VHHHDSWIETNLMSRPFLFHYLMLDMFRMLIHPSSGACNLFVELFHGFYCSGSMRVGVTLWFGWGGVVSGWNKKASDIKLVSLYSTPIVFWPNTQSQSAFTHYVYCFCPELPCMMFNIHTLCTQYGLDDYWHNLWSLLVSALLVKV